MNKKNKFDGLLQGAVKQQNQQHEQIKNAIVIDTELQDWIPALTKEEYEQLKNNILSQGCRDALILWQQENNYILVDGHNRYKICKAFGIDFDIKLMAFEDKEAVKLYMLNIQLGRRNLTSEQLSYLRGKRYAQEKSIIGNKEGKNQYTVSGQNDHQTPEDLSGHFDHQASEKTSKLLAQEFGVGEKTIRRDAQFAKAIDKIGEINPVLRKEILSGATRINKSQIQEIAKMDTLPHLENIQDLENLFLSKTEKATDELKAKKEFLIKFIKNSNDLMSLEQIEKLCLALAKKS